MMMVVVLVYLIVYLLTRRPRTPLRVRGGDGSSRYSLSGRHVVVTGGSSGIGECVAALMLAKGASVTLVARRKAALEEAALRLARGAGDGCFRKRAADATRGHEDIDEGRLGVCAVDVTDYPRLRRAIEAAEMRRGKVSVLICSAGMSKPGCFSSALMTAAEGKAVTGARALATRAEKDIDVIRQHMRVNWEGSVNAVHACMDSIAVSGSGRVVLISSQAGQVGLYGYTGYSSSKFALRGFAEALQMEMMPYNCRVCVAYPPDTDTPQLAEENKTKPEELKAISGSPDTFRPARVAAAIVRGTERGDFCIPIGFDGWMLGILTTGMSPASHGDALGSIVCVFLMGIFRSVAIVYLYSWFNTVAKIARRRRSDAKKST